MPSSFSYGLKAHSSFKMYMYSFQFKLSRMDFQNYVLEKSRLSCSSLALFYLKG